LFPIYLKGILSRMRRMTLIALLIFVVLSSAAPVFARNDAPSLVRAAQILETLTPEEKVGQLFIVSVEGSLPTPDNVIFRLISDHHISGVVLRSESDTIVDPPKTLETMYELTTALQSAEFSEINRAVSLDEPDAATPNTIPLFIAITQEGNGSPYSSILSGMTPLPSEMAIGATWDTDLSRQVGAVLGAELEALGINLVFGPSLDVLDDPRITGPGDLGVRAFGGDPFWVGEMGKAYIEGLHSGSNQRLGVIAKHFPGLGGVDRPPQDEVSTVRKSLGELEQIDLVPFFNVAASPPGDLPITADGFLASNIRYQGFQGNIRATTRPVNLDREAYTQLLGLDGLTEWREGGGLTVSDSLGSKAIRRFLESLGQNFLGHIVAKDAFLAGNDLLLLEDFQSTSDEDEITTILATLAFFAQKYREDSVFAQRVDEAVLRILNLKIRLYGNDFSLETVLPDRDRMAQIGTSNEVTVQVARSSASLISPSIAELEENFPAAPRLGERIVFITDTRLAWQCSTCQPREVMHPSALEEAVLRLYGPQAAGQVASWSMTSFTLVDLANYLGVSSEISPELVIAPAETVADALRDADWIIFSILRPSEDYYGSDGLQQFLDTLPSLAFDKKLIVFGHDVPYDLDATDISKVSAYYALYSKTSPFIEVAARLLFKELSPIGASPVDVPGVGYDLIHITSPNSSQIIPLFLLASDNFGPVIEPFESFMQGERASVRTGVILDNNGIPVPDGTPVHFYLTYQGESVPAMIIEAQTAEGIAEAAFILDRADTLVVRVESLEARNSDLLEFNIIGEPGEVDASPTVSPVPSATIEPTPIPTADAGGALVEETDDVIPSEGGVDFLDFIIGVTTVGVVAGIAFAFSSLLAAATSMRVRLVLWILSGGLFGYNYLAFGLPGSQQILSEMGRLSAFLIAGAGGILFLMIMIVWKTRRWWR
jgi:beta-N-acetylhexosaminidase